MKIKHQRLNFAFLMALLIILFSFGAFASESKKRLIDNAELLDSSEFQNISSKLDEISERQQMDIVILTEKSLNGKSSKDYADDYFDYKGYGMGENGSGVLLLINMNERNSYISTKGRAINAFTDAGLDYILDHVVPEIKSKNYEEAFNVFADLCDEFITKANTDKPYDSGNLPKKPINNKIWIPGSLLIGLALSWLIVKYMKDQLKTARKKPKADDYVRSGSLQIKNCRDIFLYSNITRRARPKSSSGSSTHRSSSGSIHGGRGRGF